MEEKNREIKELSNKISELNESINKLNNSVNKLFELFELANKELMEQYEKDKPVQRLKRLEEQNSEIAKGVLAIADIIEEKLKFLDELKEVIGEFKEKKEEESKDQRVAPQESVKLDIEEFERFIQNQRDSSLEDVNMIGLESSLPTLSDKNDAINLGNVQNNSVNDLTNISENISVETRTEEKIEPKKEGKKKGSIFSKLFRGKNV